MRHSVHGDVLHQTVGTGQANAKAYNRQLCGLIEQGKSKPPWIVFQELSLDQEPQADRHFGHREDGWANVLLHLDGS